MDDAADPGSLAPGTGHPALLAGAAVLAAAAFRVGLAPGGLVGIDVGLALVGWWLGAGLLRDGETLARRVAEGWRRVWVSVTAALVLAVAWVLLTPSTARDRLVRGEALAVVGGYGNWHQLSLGPPETSATRLVSPLQHLWVVSVVVQLVIVCVVLARLTRRRAQARPGRRDPMVLVSAGAAGASLAAVVAASVLGASGQVLLLSTWARGPAFFLGVAVGALHDARPAETLRAVAVGTRWLVAGLLLALVALASPTSTVWRSGGAVVAPVLAVLLVVAFVPWPPGRRSRAAEPALDRWLALTAWWAVHVPVLALVAPARTDLPAPVASLAGLTVSVGVAWAVAWLGSHLSTAPETLEVRRVLLPPLVALLLVVVLSVTGAFHWASPRPVPGTSAGQHP